MQNNCPVRCTAGRKIVSIALIFKKIECLEKMTQKSCIIRFFVGESPSWLRHRILIPACEGSSPSSPATFFAFLLAPRAGIAYALLTL